MKFLLDTHTVIWAQKIPQRLSRNASQVISDEQNIIFVSAASAWEMATKVRIGKLPEAESLEQDFIGAMSDAGFVLLPIEVETALRAGRLVGDHKDPFDRMLAAHALAQDMPIISADPKLDVFGIRRVW